MGEYILNPDSVTNYSLMSMKIWINKALTVFRLFKV